MNRLITNSLLVAGFFFYSQSGLALFKGYVGVGYTKGDLELDTTAALSEIDFDGTKFAGGFYLQPVPLVPVGIGASAEFADFGDEDGLDERKLYALRPELTAWLPLVKVKKLKPFIKVGYTLGWMRLEAGSGDLDLKYNGLQAGVGFTYSPIPLLEIMLQYQRGFEQAEVSEASIGGVTSSFFNNGDEGDYENNTVLLGVQAGI
jgi:hypothetical protein